MMQVLFSDSAEPGEADQKCMGHIRFLRTLPDYNPNTRHVIYGQVRLEAYPSHHVGVKSIARVRITKKKHAREDSE
jgi:hypothetical protein